MFMIIVFDYVLIRFSLVSSQDFNCSLPRDQSRDVTPHLGVFLSLQCTCFRVCVFISANIENIIINNNNYY